MRAFLIFLILVLSLTKVTAQIESPGEPLSRSVNLTTKPQQVRLMSVTPTMIGALQESYQHELKPFLFAYPIDTVIPVLQSGQWDTVGQNLICRMTIHSDGAESLNVIFGKFRLPENASVFLYTPDYQVVRGAFTSLNHTSAGQLATLPLPGSSVTIELNMPLDSQEPEIEISRISHDFTGVFKADDAYKRSGSCNVDINCPPGADWQVEKNAVVKFIRGGTWLCSGSLINNTANDGRPLLLTANHCIGLPTHAEQSVFFFRYERPGCGSGTATPDQTLSASKLLATYPSLDFSLVELSSSPPEDYQPYYAGWNRRIVAYYDTVVAIHHPRGDAKKISKSYHRVVTGDFGGGFESNTHWRVSQWDLGTTEPGSSGCPLFNTDHQIIGDLTGGDASCDYNFNDYFQKFSVSWDRYPDSSNQLKYWLDPLNSGAQIINGYDPFMEGKPLANFEIRPNPAEAGKILFFHDRSTGAPTTWEWVFEGGIPERSVNRDPGAVVFPDAGIHQVTLIVSNEIGSDSLRQSLLIVEQTDYSVSETRIVPLRMIEISDQSSGNPQLVTFTASGAFPAIWTGPETFRLSYSKPGDYTITHQVEYPGKTISLTHYNQIRVVNEAISFQSTHIRNTADHEHTVTHDFGNQGYFPGSNTFGISQFAEEFINESDSRQIISGITFPIQNLNIFSDDYYLTCCIWDANWELIASDSVNISTCSDSSFLTVRFKYPVMLDTLVYAGYQIKSWDQGTFASRASVDRGLNEKNTAYIFSGNKWLSASDQFGIKTSLDLSLEVTPIGQNFKDQIQITSGNTLGQFIIDLGNLVFNQADITVYDMMLRQMTTTVSYQANQIFLSFSPPASGMYVVRIQLDQLVFYRSVLGLRD